MSAPRDTGSAPLALVAALCVLLLIADLFAGGAGMTGAVALAGAVLVALGGLCLAPLLGSREEADDR